MNPRSNIVLLACVLAGCSGETGSQAPAPPPLQLRSQLAELKALAAKTAPPQALAQKELRELGDLALHLVEADARTTSRAELSLLEHADAWWVLEPALVHEKVEVRRRAAWLCGRSGQPALQLALALRLKYELDPETVVWVAQALAQLGNDLGLAWIDAAIPAQATAEQAGAAAIVALRARGVELTEQPSWEQLRQKLAEHGDHWRATGVSSLKDPESAPAELTDARFATHLVTTEGTLLRPIDDARFVLTRCGRLPVPLLTRTLTASEPYLRTMALQVLAELGPLAADAAPAVLPLLGDPLTNSYAVRTLGEMGAQASVPLLRPLLAHVDSELRAAATQALGLLHDAASHDALRARLDDANETLDVRVGAAFGLRCLGADAAADTFLAERLAKKDYHEPTVQRLIDRLAAKKR